MSMGQNGDGDAREIYAESLCIPCKQIARPRIKKHDVPLRLDNLESEVVFSTKAVILIVYPSPQAIESSVCKSPEWQ
jgi:hypothetical protein